MACNLKTSCKEKNVELRKELVIDGTGQLRVPHVSHAPFCLIKEIDNESMKSYAHLCNQNSNNQKQENKEKLYVVSIVKGELEIVPANTVVTSGVTNLIKSENDKSFLVKEELKTDYNDQAIDEINQEDTDSNVDRKIDQLKIENRNEQYAGYSVKEELIVKPEILHESFACNILADASCPRDQVVWAISEEGNNLNKDIKLEFQTIHEDTITESILEKNDREFKNASLDINNFALLNVKDIAEGLDESVNITGDNTKNGYFTCNKCEYQTIVIDALKKHIKLHDVGRRFECDLCGFRFITKQHLITHITHRHSKVECCNICNYKSTSKSNLQRHAKRHNNEKHVFTHSSKAKMDNSKKQYNCTYCTYSSNRKYSLTLHIRAHTGEKPYRCTYCKYRCNSSSTLRYHLNRHTGVKPYVCTFCNYSTNSCGSIKEHLRIHTGEKPYHCTYCKYSSSRKSNLKTHIRTHTGEKPYTCTFCKHPFSECSTFKRHLRTHTGEKPYTCTHCEYSCNQINNLKEHIKTHTSDKTYTCCFCKYNCSKSVYLKKHMKNHTQESIHL